MLAVITFIVICACLVIHFDEHPFHCVVEIFTPDERVRA